MAGATVLALLAALLHAGWNLLAKRHDDRIVALWALFLMGGALALVLLLASGDVARVAWPYAVASGLVHIPYVLLLAHCYAIGDFSVAYPLARGGGALVAALGGALVLGDSLPLAGWVAIAIVCIGLASFGRGGDHGHLYPPAGLLALVIGTYTVVDGAGSRASSSAAYGLAVFVAIALFVSLYGLAAGLGPRLVGALKATPWLHLGAGTASLCAYALVLVAVRWAPVGYVAALRESAVVLSAVAGWRLLKEPFGAARVASSLVVLSGLVLLVTTR